MGRNRNTPSTKKARVRKQLLDIEHQKNAYNVHEAIKRLGEDNAKLHEEARSLDQIRRDSELENIRLNTQVDGLNKDLIGVRKYRDDLEWGFQRLKESLQAIRDLHTREIADLVEPMCGECKDSWPCPTIQAINIPEQAIINRLLEIEQELKQNEELGNPASSW